jgi:hypothetical protein
MALKVKIFFIFKLQCPMVDKTSILAVICFANYLHSKKPLQAFLECPNNVQTPMSNGQRALNRLGFSGLHEYPLDRFYFNMVWQLEKIGGMVRCC